LSEDIPTSGAGGSGSPPATEGGPPPAGDASLESALARLDQIVERLESGDLDLDQAVTAYEEGVRLARHCAALLEATERRVVQVLEGPEGQLTLVPLTEPVE
jgi:exodeoxyribonuclease VII small subunit